MRAFDLFGFGVISFQGLVLKTVSALEDLNLALVYLKVERPETQIAG